MNATTTGSLMTDTATLSPLEAPQPLAEVHIRARIGDDDVTFAYLSSPNDSPKWMDLNDDAVLGLDIDSTQEVRLHLHVGSSDDTAIIGWTAVLQQDGVVKSSSTTSSGIIGPTVEASKFVGDYEISVEHGSTSRSVGFQLTRGSAQFMLAIDIIVDDQPDPTRTPS